MAWIELHQALKRHPKLSDLAVELETKRVYALGHLVSFWLEAIDFAQDGSVSKFKPATLAEWAMWDEDPDTFVSAMQAAGFIDEDGLIHDWDEYAGRLLEKRNANKARAKRWRESNIPNAYRTRTVSATNTATNPPHSTNQPTPPTTRERGISRGVSGGVKSQPWRCLKKIATSELVDPVQLDVRLDAAMDEGRWPDTDAARIQWFALACRAVRLGKSPGAMFRKLVQDNPDCIEGVDEDAATALINGRGAPKPEKKKEHNACD